MYFRKALITAALLTSAATLSAADFVIPAVGTGQGAAGSRWRSEVTFHNAGTAPIVASLAYSSGTMTKHSTVTVQPQTTLSFADILSEKFDVIESFGALEIDVDNASLRKLAIASRAVNVSPNGEFGQDVPALMTDDLIVDGDTAVVAGPREAATSRFNFGLYTVTPTEVEWSLVRSNGSVAATKTSHYPAATHTQYNAGVQSFFGTTAENNDVVRAKVLSGSAYFYGSTINSQTGDPTFIHAIPTRQNLQPTVLGVDIDENGTVDVADANHDLRVDQQIEVFTVSFPNYFRLVVNDPEGETLTYQLLNFTNEAKIGSDGLIQWVPSGDLAGQVVELAVRVSDGTDSVDVIIPIVVR